MPQSRDSRRGFLKSGAAGLGGLGIVGATAGFPRSVLAEDGQKAKSFSPLYSKRQAGQQVKAEAVSDAWERIVLEPAQDNTLYETAIDQDGVRNEMSNGAGDSLFVGRTGLDAGYKRRRVLLRFDLENALPPGAEIIHAEFSLHQTKAAPNSPPAVMGLHRVLQSWGEGASNAVGPEGQGNFAESGDATWHHRLYPDELWTTPGGEYEPNTSAETTVGRILNRFTWACTPAMLADLRFWRDHPESNFGWAVVGGEDAGFSAHKFSSRENNTQANRPALVIVFSTLEDVFSDSFESSPECTNEP